MGKAGRKRRNHSAPRCALGRCGRNRPVNRTAFHNRIAETLGAPGTPCQRACIVAGGSCRPPQGISSASASVSTARENPRLPGNLNPAAVRRIQRAGWPKAADCRPIGYEGERMASWFTRRRAVGALVALRWSGRSPPPLSCGRDEPRTAATRRARRSSSSSARPTWPWSRLCACALAAGVGRPAAGQPDHGQSQGVGRTPPSHGARGRYGARRTDDRPVRYGRSRSETHRPQGQLESSRAQLALAEKTRAQNLALLKQNFISQNAYDSAESIFNVTQGRSSPTRRRFSWRVTRCVTPW